MGQMGWQVPVDEGGLKCWISAVNLPLNLLLLSLLLLGQAGR